MFTLKSMKQQIIEQESWVISEHMTPNSYTSKNATMYQKVLLTMQSALKSQ